MQTYIDQQIWKCQKMGGGEQNQILVQARTLKQARVHNKLRFMNSPKGSLMGDDLNIFQIYSQYSF